MQQDQVRFIHLRSRKNGIASDKGGYTIAIKGRPSNMYALSICQCNTNQRYDEKLGEKIAEQRLARGQFFVQDKAQVVATLNTLHNKLCTGSIPKLALDALD